ncbi:MAG TPA: N-6 DNA methylase [Nitrospiraceae bacterium]|nr:N-6 DNA methylase [Nitrospiraceae bacterium]
MARSRKNGNGNGKRLATQQSVNGAIKSICDIMRRSNCAGALQYVPELTWILFLRILDEREARESEEAEAVGAPFTLSLDKPYRWQDWAAPDGWKRTELQNGASGAFFGFVNGELIPHLKKLRERPNATPRQKVLSEIFSGVDRTRIDTERNLLDVLDKVHEISAETVDPTHVFTLSQVYEGLLLKMGEKGNDGGQFFTPREIIRAMVKVVAPKIGETVYDPGCGTGGFLAQAFEHMAGPNNANIRSADQLETLKRHTFYGREKDNAIYPIGLANLVLHNIDEPHIWHGNALTGAETYGGLFVEAPTLHDVILMNPPFGGKEGKDAQTRFAYKTGATQVLFLQHVIDSLKTDGRCGIVIDEGVLFRTNETAFVQTKRKLLDECDLWCIVSLPGGVFTAAGAGVKTNLLFFTKGKPTEKIWYYDLSDIKVGKKHPFKLEHFTDFFGLLPTRGDSDRSWTLDIAARRAAARQQAEPLRKRAETLAAEALQHRERLKDLKKAQEPDSFEMETVLRKISEAERSARDVNAQAQTIEDAAFDLKAVNPNAKSTEDTRTPEQLLDLIEAKGRDVAAALAQLRLVGSENPSDTAFGEKL